MATIIRSIRPVLGATRCTISRASCRKAFLSTIPNSTSASSSPPESIPIASQSSKATESTKSTFERPKTFTPNTKHRRSRLPSYRPSDYQPPPKTFIPRHPALNSRPPPTPSNPIQDTLDLSAQELLPLLRSQPQYYTTLQIHGKNYLVTTGDSVRLPFVMQGVEPGDIIRLNRATLIGSRDYTLKAGTTEHKRDGQRFLDERLYVIRARVMGVVREPERVKVKKKPRQRHARYTTSQHSYTVLRIMEVSLTDFDGSVDLPVDGSVNRKTFDQKKR